MMWFVGRLITGGLATCRMTVLRGKWRAMVGRPLPATDAPAVPRAVANDHTGILGSSGGGVSQASMAAWSPAEGYVSFRWRAVVNGTSGKNFGGGICGGASGGERALWGAELSYGYAGGRNREQRRRQTGLVFVGTALERPSLAGTCSGAVGVAFGRHLVF